MKVPTPSASLPFSAKVCPPIHDLNSTEVKSEAVDPTTYMEPPAFTPPTPEDFDVDPKTMEEARNAVAGSGKLSEKEETPASRDTALLEPVGYGGYNNMQIAILKSTSFSACRTPEERAVACSVAKKYDLDPFIQEIWAIVMKGKMVIQASAAGWRKMITRKPEVKRLISNAVYAGDTLKIDHVNGTFEHEQIISADKKPDENENPLGAYAAALMDDGTWTVKYVRWEEYDRSKEDSYNAWHKQKSEMICNKAVTVLGRSSFGISGVYLPGEITPDTIDLPESAFQEERIATGKAAKAVLRDRKSV